MSDCSHPYCGRCGAETASVFTRLRAELAEARAETWRQTTRLQTALEERDAARDALGEPTLVRLADDQPLPEDDAIKAAHPMRSDRHDLYAEAMRLVGAKHSKGALVELVNWLLHEREAYKEG